MRVAASVTLSKQPTLWFEFIDPTPHGRMAAVVYRAAALLEEESPPDAPWLVEPDVAFNRVSLYMVKDAEREAAMNLLRSVARRTSK